MLHYTGIGKPSCLIFEKEKPVGETNVLVRKIKYLYIYIYIHYKYANEKKTCIPATTTLFNPSTPNPLPGYRASRH